MKKYYILLAALFISLTLNAQIIDFPDADFKYRLITTNCVDTNDDGYFDDDADTNNDGEIDINEAQAVIALDIARPVGSNWPTIISLEGIEYFSNLLSLDCSNHAITSINASVLNSLETLNWSRNTLGSIDFSTLINIKHLAISNCSLSSLDLTLLTSIETLNCTVNPLNTIDVSALTTLKHLSVGQCSLSSLDINNLVNLETLMYSFNEIPTINLDNQTNLQEVNCRSNNITSLEFLSNLNQLKILDCSDNLLTNLDTSNFTNLEELNCQNNQLTTLEIIDNENIHTLNCGNNNLTSLTLSGLSTLSSLRCGQNELTILDLSDTSISNLFAANNQLTYINIKNGTITYPEEDIIYVFNNPDLQVICADLDEVGNLGVGSVQITTYCSFTPGGDYNTAQGQTFFDINSNGCDDSDLILPHLVYNISSDSSSGEVISNDLGEYAFYLGNNTYTFYPTLENPTYFTVTPPNVTITFPDDTSPYLQDFCVTPNGTHHDLEITLLPTQIARPGFDATYKLIYKNKGTTTLSGTIDFTFMDAIMDFVSASPSEDSQSTNVLSWSFTDLLPFESREITLTMNINAPTDTPPVNGGDVLEFIATVNSSETDETPDDNTSTLNQTVVNSYDPNDKTCLEGDFITPEMVGKYVHYMIRFENTGTADAINIVVKDDIDISKYDLSTLVPIDASHNFVARIKDQGSSHYVEFIFENINLPFDDANNDGYIAFKIKTLNSLQLGDTFDNNAEIYFDYNFPIITNVAQTTVATLSVDDFELANSSIVLYPNPTTNLLQIDAQQNIEHVNIYDVSGRLIKKIAIIGTKTQVEISTESLTSGTYFVKIESENGTVVKKVIKD